VTPNLALGTHIKSKLQINALLLRKRKMDGAVTNSEHRAILFLQDHPLSILRDHALHCMQHIETDHRIHSE